MEYNDNSTDKNYYEKENGKRWCGLLVPYKYIKKALLRIWSFLIKGLSVGLKCKQKYLIILIVVVFYIGIPILLESRNNQFIQWLKRNGGFKKEFIIQNFNNDDEIL